MLLLGASLDGYAAAGFALVLLVARVVVLPGLRRARLAAAVIAALAAGAVVLILRAL